MKGFSVGQYLNAPSNVYSSQCFFQLETDIVSIFSIFPSSRGLIISYPCITSFYEMVSVKL